MVKHIKANKTVDISVVLCTWNNAPRLRITLDAIAKCEVPEVVKWELVLVNNNCTDDTDFVVDEFAHLLPLNYVKEPEPGLSHARNAGLAAATGELIIFTDDDVRPYPNWLESYWDAYRRLPEGYYFGGPLESEFETQPPDEALLQAAPWSVKGLDWGSDEVSQSGLKFVSANWACPRIALDEAGGFDSGLGLVGGSKRVAIGEETDLMRRLQEGGWTPRYLPTARLRHFVPADKTAVRHIAERGAAYGYYRTAVLRTHAGYSGPFIGGVPLKLLDTLARSWFYWFRVKAGGGDADLQYVYWKRASGEVKGAFDLWRGQSKKSNRNGTSHRGTAASR